MRRASAIGLVLMGGGLAASLYACGRTGDSQECREARAGNLPEAEQICARSRSSRSSSSSGGHGWGWSSSGSERGGFGSTAHASSGG